MDDLLGNTIVPERSEGLPMRGDIVDELRHAIMADRCPWDVTVYERAIDEIERLRRGEKKVFPPLLHHNGHLEVVERDGLFGVVLLVDGWYVDKGEAHAVMCDHWSLALEEARRG